MILFHVPRVDSGDLRLWRRVLLPEQACGDRDADAHRDSLRDLDLKYADVRPLEECLALLG